jgi:hypothetical protein
MERADIIVRQADKAYVEGWSVRAQAKQLLRRLECGS